MTLSLRPYQREALDALYGYWNEGGGSPLIVLPTGAGKSLVIATLCRELLAQWPSLRIGIVTHVKELIAQNAQELLRAWPQAPVGIYSAGLNRRDAHAKILFMGIQSVHNKSARLGDFDLLLVDEAHLIPRTADTMYGRFIAECRKRVPDMRLVGLTATPYRLDSGRLDRGDGALFDAVCYDANVADLIEAGYLSPLVSKPATAQIDTSGVHVRGGEFVAGELETAAMKIVKEAVQEIVERGADRHGWLAFCSGVDHARLVRDEIRKHGISCDMVTGDTPAAERDSIINAYKRREIRCLTSVGVLTTGFNAPHVDLLAMLRSTLSTGLYVQMVGRAFRLAPDKADALILDFAGNVRRHGPIDAVTPHGGPSGDGDSKVRPDAIQAKECQNEACGALVALQTVTCPHCGFQWPRKEEPKHVAHAEAVAILTREQAPEWLTVDRVAYARHEKFGSPDSLRVDYFIGMRSHREWWCFEHQGFARDKAGQIWRMAGGQLPVPTTVDQAMARLDEVRPASEIRLRRNDKYFEVVGRRYQQAHEVAA
jgi:DNA repair protein RadD